MDNYQIVFRGRLAPGADESEVKANLATLFKIDAARVEALFSSRRKVLKQGLKREEADHYRNVLRQAGAMVSVVNAEVPSAAAEAGQPPPSPATAVDRAVFRVHDAAADPAETPAPSPGEAPIAADSPGQDDGQSIVTGVAAATLAPPGAQLSEKVVVSAPEISVVGLDLASVGAILDESRPPPPLQVDLGDLTASDDFEQLDESPPAPEPQIEIFDLDLADPEAIVDESPPPPPKEFDLGDLSFGDDYEALDEQVSVPEPEIDIRHLTLEKD